MTAQSDARKAVCAALDWSQVDIATVANAFGCSYVCIAGYRHQLGIKGFERIKVPDDRVRRMADLYATGKTLEDIGQEFQLTRERVRQLLRGVGVTRDHGGQKLKTIENARKKENHRRALWDERTARVYGCTFDLALELNGGANFSTPRSKARIYVEQRRNSLRRAIAWNMSFPEWCRVWDESGRWDERGRGHGYCMARVGDSGPYEVGNVEIITCAQNSADSYLVSPAKERFKSFKITDHLHMSPRIRQAARYVEQGKDPKEVARLMGVSRHVAWTYMAAARKKLAMLAANADQHQVAA